MDSTHISPLRLAAGKRDLPRRRWFAPARRRRAQGSGEKPRAIVIGAGLGGLSAGIHLARQGWDVQIIERNERCGGRMNVIEKDGFRIDMGPTMLMMPEVVSALFESCGRRVEDYLNLQKLTPAYRIYWPDGSTFDMSDSLAAVQEEMRKFSPEDAARFPALHDAMRRKYQNARYNFIERSFNTLGTMFRPSTLSGVLRAMPLESVYKFVGRYLTNEKLLQAFTFQTLYLGISPMECPSIYALLPYIEMEFGVWYPRGGMIELADALEKLFLELGGEVRYRTSAAKVLLEGNCATGVRTVEGEDLHADVVISNMDLPTAYNQLLPESVRRKHTGAALSRRNYGCSGYMMYLGVKDMKAGWPHNSIILSDNYTRVLEDICHTKCMPGDPAMHVCVPTRTDPSLAPDGHDVLYVLVPCPHAGAGIDWKTEGPALRERVLDKLERSGFPGLRDSIVFEQDFTPEDFEQTYGCYAGAAFGGLTPTFLQSGYFRPHNRSEDIRNLFFVGASTHPGGGIPIVLTSGRLVADAVCAR